MKYQLNKTKVLLTKVADEGVLFDIEANRYVGINETFLAIIEQVEKGKSVSEITDELCKIYNISPQDCLQEVRHVITELLDKNYIEEVNA